MNVKRVLSLVKLEITRQFTDVVVLVFTTLLVPALIVVFGLIMNDSYGWDDTYTVFEIMLPGFLAFCQQLFPLTFTFSVRNLISNNSPL